MSYIGIDLKVIEGLAAGAARASGTNEDRVLAGLVRTWHRVWSSRADIMTRADLAAVFGGERLDELIEALTAGFLEPRGDGSWRIRGAGRYLRVKVAQSDAGKANAGNLKRGTKVPGSSPAHPRLEPEVVPALSPSTEHRAPSTERKEEAPPPQKLVVRPPPIAPPDKFANGSAFWSWAQWKRHEVGHVAEKPPHPQKLSSWWSDALMELNGRPERLEPAFYKFAEDPHWDSRTPSMPFAGFMSVWRNFVPPEKRHA